MRNNNLIQLLVVFAIFIIITVAIIAGVASTVSSPSEIVQPQNRWDFWVGRIMTATIMFHIFITVPISLLYFRRLDKILFHQEKIKTLELQEKPPQNIIMNKRYVSHNSDMVILRSGKVQKQSVIKFVKGAMEHGLGIGVWKSLGLKQDEIELILDHLQELRVITERSQGISSKWAKRIDTTRLINYFPLHMDEVFPQETKKE